MITLTDKKIHQLQQIVYDAKLKLHQVSRCAMPISDEVAIVLKSHRDWLTVDDLIRVLFIVEPSRLYSVLRKMVKTKQASLNIVRLDRTNELRKYKYLKSN